MIYVRLKRVHFLLFTRAETKALECASGWIQIILMILVGAGQIPQLRPALTQVQQHFVLLVHVQRL